MGGIYSNNKYKADYLYENLAIQNKKDIYNLCKKNTGHKIISEREQGPYGIVFHYCEYCGYEYY